jgi:hypothetical protein
LGDELRGEGIGVWDGGLVGGLELLLVVGSDVVVGSFGGRLVRFLRVGWRGCVFGSG